MNLQLLDACDVHCDDVDGHIRRIDRNKPRVRHITNLCRDPEIAWPNRALEGPRTTNRNLRPVPSKCRLPRILNPDFNGSGLQPADGDSSSRINLVLSQPVDEYPGCTAVALRNELTSKDRLGCLNRHLKRTITVVDDIHEVRAASPCSSSRQAERRNEDFDKLSIAQCDRFWDTHHSPIIQVVSRTQAAAGRISRSIRFALATSATRRS